MYKCMTIAAVLVLVCVSGTQAQGSPGDLNCDLVVDGRDIAPFVMGSLDPAAYEAAYPDCPWSNADMNCDAAVDATDIFFFLECLLGGLCDHCGAVIETVTIGNPGNTGEWTGEGYGGGGPARISGAVSCTYNIGTYEVTAGQYTKFLNAVAASDPHGLYNPSMDSSSYGCQITRNGSDGSYTYDFSGRPSGTEADWADRPVNYVSWGDAARFANWLHNGQPTGAPDLTTTEDGSYFLDGAMIGAELLTIARKPDATWVIPSEDEWHKAAYHKNDGVTGNYFDYPTSSDGDPGYVNNSGNLSGTGTPFMEGGTDPGNYATCDDDGSPYGIGSPYYRTEVGEWENSNSPYGTFDQGGNVWEWNESILYVLYRGLRGGPFDGTSSNALAVNRGWTFPVHESSYTGFRVADVPSCDSCGVVIETVTVGNPGNTGELAGFGAGGYGPNRITGAVAYTYNIGKYEVTAGQYAEFLNAVAATDTHALYNPSMDSSLYGCQITRNGSSGSYTYDFSGGTVEAPGSTAADWADRPVNWVSWGDAARFANWLHNCQPTGAQDLTTTEDGSYYLNGATSGAQLMAITREPDARWVIPSEDEWYKAAYHKNDGVTGNYWNYPTSSDSVPSNDLIDPDPGNNVTFRVGVYTIGSPYYRTESGDHENSNSPYGTFDQGGNVWEWIEAITYGGSYRGTRGGSFYNTYQYLLAFERNDGGLPTYETDVDGFRVAEVP